LLHLVFTDRKKEKEILNDTHVTSGRWKYGLFLTMFAAVMWGMLPTLLKIIVADVDALAVTWYRLALAFAILFVFLAARKKLPNLRQLDRKYFLLLLITCLGLCVNYITYILGIEIIGPGPTQVVLQINVVLIILGGVFIFGESFNRVQAAGLLAIIAGLAMFFHSRLVELFSSFSEYSYGVLFILLSAISLATYVLAQKQLLVKFSSLQISMVIFGAGALIFYPLTTDAVVQVFRLGWSSIALLIFCVVVTLGAFGSFAEALQHWETTKITAVLSTGPLIALAFAELTVFLFPGIFENDPISILSMAGAIVLVVGSYLVARKAD
jgi:drug/metabolite transporter (DMT)-like permease